MRMHTIIRMMKEFFQTCAGLQISADASARCQLAEGLRKKERKKDYANKVTPVCVN